MPLKLRKPRKVIHIAGKNCGSFSFTIEFLYVLPVCAYQKKPLEEEVVQKLEEIIGTCNGESGLHIQLITDEPQWFKDRIAAALLVPTAMNQQKFYIERKGNFFWV